MHWKLQLKWLSSRFLCQRSTVTIRSRTTNKYLKSDAVHCLGGIPERVRNLPSLLTADEDGKTADRLFYDLVRASQLGNIVLVIFNVVIIISNGKLLVVRKTVVQAYMKLDQLNLGNLKIVTVWVTTKPNWGFHLSGQSQAKLT